MATTTVKTPYSTAMPYVIGDLPSFISSEYEAQRLASYDLYDDLYDNDPDTHRFLLRGTDEKPIYVPTAKRIINTLARYVGRGWGFTVDRTGLGEEGGPSEEQYLAAVTAFGQLFERERILSKFATGKKEWLRRGDWIWYIQADPEKAAGRRITVKCIDPRTYFVDSDPNDPDRIIAASIVEEVLLADGETSAMKVQRWIKPSHPEHPNYGQESGEEPFDIAHDVVIYEYEGWDNPEERTTLQQVVPLEELPGIKALPLYHIRNNESTGNPFGRSDLSGIESIVAGINQTVSDEDIALAMAGLGMWVTDAGSPRDEETGAPVDWIIGPKRVAEVPVGRTFERADGITSIEPSQTHIRYLEEQAYGTNGINDIALGSKGVQESGLALAIRMQPLFDMADEKDAIANGVLTQMLHDLKMWFSVYEQMDLGPIRVLAKCDNSDRLPFDRQARYTELLEGHRAGIFTLEYVVEQLQNDFGYTFGSGYVEAAEAEQQRQASMADPYGSRVAGELGE